MTGNNLKTDDNNMGAAHVEQATIMNDFNKGHRFDICISNPPYDNGICEKFLEKYLNISNVIVSVQPVTWLTGKKQNKRITSLIDGHYADIDVINGNSFFDAGLMGNMSIDTIYMNKSGKIICYNKEYDKCEDIKPWSKDEYMTAFKECVGDIDDSIWDHIKHNMKWGHGYEENPNPKWWCIKIPQIRGHISKVGNKESKDFYTIISNDEDFLRSKANYGQYKDISTEKNRKGGLEFGYFYFDNKKELDNFINYIKTDFVRASLFLLKTNANNHRGEFKYIPWFDFSKDIFSKSPSEIDDYLFDKYNISEEIRNHIEEILPDYYNIRK